MSEIDQAEQETMQNVHFMLNTLESLEDYLLNATDDMAQDFFDRLEKEERNAYGNLFATDKAVKELKDRINDIEWHNQLKDREQERLEKEMQYCRPWEFSKKNDLKIRIDDARNDPREDTEPLKQQLRGKTEEYQKNKTEYESLKERREYLEEKLHTRQQGRKESLHQQHMQKAHKR